MKARRLQTRIARHISFAVLVSFIAGAVILMAHRHSLMVRSLESSARTYTALVSLPVVETVSLFRSTGRHILEKRVQRWRELNEDLVALEVLDVQGQVVMSSGPDGLLTFVDGEARPGSGESELLDRVRSLELSAERVADPDGRSYYRVVAPAVEELPRRLWRDPAVPEHGRPMRIHAAAGMGLVPGERVRVQLAPR